MAQPGQLTPPVMRSAARFHGDDGRPEAGKERQHVAATQLLAQNQTLVRVDPYAAGNLASMC